ncbi:TadE family protein [Proteinivorax tanatarense]|uniref:TadE family protein n=1 Tax=Proteinivorax tanatarense TaxID=1260629 RepID=A0AAU7VJT3_9FIRM
MQKEIKGLLKKENGYSFVEFALVLPLVLIMLGLIFDMGRAVHVKMELQHVAGEVQKVITLYEEEGVTGGIRAHSEHNNLDELVLQIINEGTNLNSDNLNVSIEESETKERWFIGHHYNQRTRRFDRINNRNDVKYVTVTADYEMPFGMFITKTILGDSIQLSESFTGLMYCGGDGWD